MLEYQVYSGWETIMEVCMKSGKLLIFRNKG